MLTAKYETTCKKCKMKIVYGAPITSLEKGGWAHYSCGTSIKPAVAPVDVSSAVVDDAFWTETELQQLVADRVAEMMPQIRKDAQDAAIKVLAERVPREVIIKIPGAKPVNVGLAHKQYARLLQLVTAGVNVWLAGPAGSGKTTAAERAADALGLRFYFNGAIDTEYKLSGFVDAHGKVVSTAFREAFSNGGVYLFDEVDASLPSATLAFNAALANSSCDFPGDTRPTPKHKDFRCVAAANTWGHGATMEYVGRNRLDAAFLDRFVQLTWDYDEDLEMALAEENRAWCERIQTLRRKARERGLKVVVSPRATIFGCKLLAAGLTETEALEACVFAKLRKEDRAQLEAV